MSQGNDNNEKRWLMAVDAESGTLLLAVEASSVEEATSRLFVVAPLVGIELAKLRRGLLWIPAAEPVDGPPAFREQYFKALERLAPLDHAAPGSTTLQ